MILALQFISVALPALLGLLWVGTNMVRAWNIRASGSTMQIILGTVIGVVLMAASVFIATLYGWIPIG